MWWNLHRNIWSWCQFCIPYTEPSSPSPDKLKDTGNTKVSTKEEFITGNRELSTEEEFISQVTQRSALRKSSSQETQRSTLKKSYRKHRGQHQVRVHTGNKEVSIEEEFIKGNTEISTK